MARQREPELMDDSQEALVYARADFAEVNAKFVGDLLAAVGSRDVSVAVDLGCGPGDILLRVHRDRPAWRILALDGASAMLELARQAISGDEAKQHISLIRGIAQRLPIRSGSMDLVFSNSLLHHLPDPRPFWDEIRRISRAGTLVFLRDLMRPPSEAVARQIVRVNAGNEPALLQEEFYRSLLAAFTPAEIRLQLDQAGLPQLRVTPSSDRHVNILGAM